MSVCTFFRSYVFVYVLLRGEGKFCVALAVVPYAFTEEYILQFLYGMQRDYRGRRMERKGESLCDSRQLFSVQFCWFSELKLLTGILLLVLLLGL